MVTVVPIIVSVSMFDIPSINVWFDVPSLKSKPTSLKLKSLSCGAVLLAASCKTCVPLRKISFLNALKYAVDVLSVMPAFDAVADPSISPSPSNSTIVLNCFEDNAPLGKSGLLKTVVWSNSCIAINCYPPLVQYQPHLKPQ